MRRFSYSIEWFLGLLLMFLLFVFNSSLSFADEKPNILDILDFNISDVKPTLDGFSEDFAKNGIIQSPSYSFNISFSNKNTSKGDFKNIRSYIGFDTSSGFNSIVSPYTGESMTALPVNRINIESVLSPSGVSSGDVIFIDSKPLIGYNPRKWIDDLYFSKSDLQLYLFINSWVYIDPITKEETFVSESTKIPLSNDLMLQFFPSFRFKSEYMLPSNPVKLIINPENSYDFETGNVGCGVDENEYRFKSRNKMFLRPNNDSPDFYYSYYHNGFVKKYVYFKLVDMYYEKDGKTTKEYNHLFSINNTEAFRYDIKPLSIDNNSFLYLDSSDSLDYMTSFYVSGFEGTFDSSLDGVFKLTYKPEILYVFDEINTISDFEKYNKSKSNKNFIFYKDFDKNLNFNFMRFKSEKTYRPEYQVTPISLGSSIKPKGTNFTPSAFSTNIFTGKISNPSGSFSTSMKTPVTKTICKNKPDDVPVSNISSAKIINNMLYIPTSNEDNPEAVSIYKDSGSAYFNSFVNWNLGGRDFNYGQSLSPYSGGSTLVKNEYIKSIKAGILKENPKFSPDKIQHMNHKDAKAYYDWYDYNELANSDLRFDISALDILYDYGAKSSPSDNIISRVLEDSDPFNSSKALFNFSIFVNGDDSHPQNNNNINMGSKDINGVDYWIKSISGIILEDNSGNYIEYYNDSFDDTFKPSYPKFYPNNFNELNDIDLYNIESFPLKDTSNTKLSNTERIEYTFKDTGFFENVDWSDALFDLNSNSKFYSNVALTPAYDVTYVSPFMFHFKASSTGAENMYIAPSLVDNNFYLNYTPLNDNKMLKQFESKNMKIRFANESYFDESFYSYSQSGSAKESSGSFYLYSKSNELLAYNLDNSLKIPYIETSLSEFPIRINHLATVDFSSMSLGSSSLLSLNPGSFKHRDPFLVPFLYFGVGLSDIYAYKVPNSLSLSKNTKTPVIDTSDDNFIYNIGLFNGLAMSSKINIIDVFPYNNDGRGSKLSGDLYLESINSIGSKKDFDIYYTDKPLDASISSTIVSDKFFEDYNFRKYTGDKVKATAIAIKGVSLSSKDFISLDLSMSVDKLSAGDLFVNTSSFSYDLGDGLKDGAQSGSAIVSSGIPDRMISGMIFDDIDETGYFEPGVTPIFDKNVDVAIFDNNNKIVQKISTSDGNYMFNGLKPGAYKVGFKTEGLDDGSYIVSKFGKEIDSNANINFTNKVPNQNTEIIEGYYLTESINIPDQKLVNIIGINLGLVYQEPVDTNKIININMLTRLDTKTNDFRPFFNEVTLTSDNGFKQTVASPAEVSTSNYRLVKQLLPKEVSTIHLASNLPLGYKFEGFKIANSIDDVSKAPIIKDGVINLSDEDIQDYYVEVILSANAKIPYVSSVYLPLTK